MPGEQRSDKRPRSNGRKRSRQYPGTTPAVWKSRKAPTPAAIAANRGPPVEIVLHARMLSQRRSVARQAVRMRLCHIVVQST